LYFKVFRTVCLTTRAENDRGESRTRQALAHNYWCFEDILFFVAKNQYVFRTIARGENSEVLGGKWGARSCGMVMARSGAGGQGLLNYQTILAGKSRKDTNEKLHIGWIDTTINIIDPLF
jgi:hypothetical protein